MRSDAMLNSMNNCLDRQNINSTMSDLIAALHELKIRYPGKPNPAIQQEETKATTVWDETESNYMIQQQQQSQSTKELTPTNVRQ